MYYEVLAGMCIGMAAVIVLLLIMAIPISRTTKKIEKAFKKNVHAKAAPPEKAVKTRTIFAGDKSFGQDPVRKRA